MRVTGSVVVPVGNVKAPHSWIRTMNHPWRRWSVFSPQEFQKHLTSPSLIQIEANPQSCRLREGEGERSEDSSEDEGPGPILLRRGRFAALAEDDTKSVDNHSRAEEEATQEIPTRRRRRLRILWQEPAEVERVTCAPTQIEPDSHEERLALVQQAVGHPWQRLAPDVREVRAAISGLSSVGSEGGSHGSSRRCSTRHQTSTLVSRVRASDVGSGMW